MKFLSTLFLVSLVCTIANAQRQRSALVRPGADAKCKAEAMNANAAARVPGVPARTAATINLPFISREYNWDAANQAWGPDSQRVGYRYTASGQQALRAAYTYSRNDSSSRIVRMYDAQGRDTSTIFYLRQSGAWSPFFKDRSVYDAQGNLVYSGLLDWDAASQSFVQSSAFTYDYQYDVQNRIAEEIYSATDFFTGVLAPQTKRIYHFPAATGGFASIVSFAADSLGNWTPEDSTADITWYNYDLYLPSYYKGFTYDAGMGMYMEDQDGTWTYNTPNDYSAIYRAFDGTNWVNFERDIQGFSGDTVSSITQDWANTVWVNSTRSLDLMDAQGNPVYSADQTWQPNQWLTNSGQLSENVYDASMTLLEVTRSKWDTANQDFERVSRSRYSNFGTFTSTKPMISKSLTVYPSPAQGSVHVRMEGQNAQKAEAIDANGKLYPLTIVNGEADVSSLKPGLYQVRALGMKGSQYQGRFVKE